MVPAPSNLEVPRRPRLRLAGRFGALMLALAALDCSHPWDDYRAAEAAGGEGSSSIVDAACIELCNGYAECGWSYPDCSTECRADMAYCTTTEIGAMVVCTVDAECTPASKAQLEDCFDGVGCFALP